MIPTPEERPTMPVEEVGETLGIGRSAAYEAVRRGEIPSIRIGRRVLVPTAALRVLLGIDAPPSPSPTPDAEVVPIRGSR